MSVKPKTFRGHSNYEHPVATRKRCPDCGMHVRGKNHVEGADHDRGVSRRSKKQ